MATQQFQKLTAEFSAIAANQNRTMDDVQAVYDNAYRYISEIFSQCSNDIYQHDYDAPSGRDAEENVMEYFRGLEILADSRPEKYALPDDETKVLKQSFKEAITLAFQHLSDKLAYRNTHPQVRGRYWECLQALNKAFTPEG